MAIWGAVAKAGAGMLKGGAKKIASKKLLGRGKKKPQKPQQGEQQEKGGALAIRPTTTLMPTGPTGIVPSGGGALATTGDSGGAGGGDSAQALAVSISSKIIRVEKLLKGSVLIKKDIFVDIYSLKKNNLYNQSRTLSISKSNVDYFNSEILKINQNNEKF